ncbi:YqcI/YcgG family protein [Sphingomonas paeninsulae]|jgi:FPC/CPF motif-containing protein YcgG|uniref:YqcI/YcgG family protein n=1 Tax=Sphingomonas paeninsulae TaxID=2319844 RepID=A0A494TJW8_SPHPE|nr:guanitoxin biosynthesis heme-dependent pre-guanitoxin N-hydroxylase GntA [Sphingomonas paeninsulae]AYJ86106.1 YqcI/YcgG family protein [Sphingomonas paeninsulae]
MPNSPFTENHMLIDQFHASIADQDFPCVGAKAALARNQIKTVVARSITSGWNDLEMHAALLEFVANYRAEDKLFQSLAVIFEGPDDLDEATFEANMWDRIQSIADKDAWLGQDYDHRVSADPNHPHFSLSFGGEAFFVVGLHPKASRPARRFPVPVMVFNLHDQFERLRAEGRYEKLRGAILDRDMAMAGSINPMLSRHGDLSEARQYSGRVVGTEWRCPFSDPRKEQSDAA